MPDFDEVVFEMGFPKSEVMTNAILDSEVGPQVAYYLANNPDEAEKIAELPPISALRAIGRLEAKFEAPPKKKAAANGTHATAAGVKKAAAPPPAPIEPVRGGTSKTVKDYSYYGDPEKSSAQEFEEARRTGKLR